MSVASASTPAAALPAPRARDGLPGWWPLAALIALAAALRISTLDLQSFWYDEAFTPVHVLHPSLTATLHSVLHSENTPPLWYVIVWVCSRVFGTGAIALRAPSALFGIATVPVAWAIGAELAGRRAAIASAVLVAVNPLFFWYSQEARAYGLYVLTAALALLCFLRLRADPTPWRVAAFALAAVLALLSQYFAVFLLAPMVLVLLWERRTRRASAPAAAVIAIAGAALIPLIAAQGGHGTQWIGRWPLSERLQAIPQYYLTGYSGKPLGRGVELLIALVLLVGLAFGARQMLRDEEPLAPAPAGGPAPSAPGPSGARADRLRGLWLVIAIAAFAVLAPIVLAVLGADYLAPRNLVAAMIPVTAAIAVVMSWPGRGRAGLAFLAAAALAFLAISLDIDLSPRLQRGNWRDVAAALQRGGEGPRAITTVELGAAPLEYYLPGLHNLARGGSIRVGEIDETGYAPLRASAAQPPAPGFRLLARLDIDGLIVYRFRSPVPVSVSEAVLRRHVITLAHPEVLVPGYTHVSG